MAGRYPPGSSFKVVTAAALLQAGLTLDTVVPCPPRAVVGGKPFTNFEGEAPGPVPFLTDFARSCNTAFVGASSRLKAQDLANAARAFGFGAKWALPLAAFAGQFPTPADAAELAAASIGQGRVLASPLGMALVAGAAATGTWNPPTLVKDPQQSGAAPPAPAVPAAVVDYNAARQPGKGSAIFLHVSTGHGTAGCVAVADPVLVSLLRWLDPARQPVIVMGPQSYVERL